MTHDWTQLLAPSFAGWKLGNGKYEHAYMTGISVSYIAALNRYAVRQYSFSPFISIIFYFDCLMSFDSILSYIVHIILLHHFYFLKTDILSALLRIIELETLMGNEYNINLYTQRRDLTYAGFVMTSVLFSRYYFLDNNHSTLAFLLMLFAICLSSFK
jgi:hypothetical protein